jgi:DNA-binding NarL/FixJ family response regulator
MIRVVVVEDSRTHLKLLGRVLGADPRVQVLGMYPNGQETLDAVDWSGVDVLLVDLELPGIPGVQLIEVAVSRNHELKPLAYTVHTDAATVYAALEAGALGYVLKRENLDEVIPAILDISEGRSPISPEIASHLLTRLRRKEPAGPVKDLSVRETSLLRLVAEGRSYKEIAETLSISANTVHNHVHNIYRKLHAENRQEALRTARVLGYLGEKVR